VVRDGEAFHAQLARYGDEAPIHGGAHLASVFASVFVTGGEEFTGTAVASVSIDEGLPASLLTASLRQIGKSTPPQSSRRTAEPKQTVRTYAGE
jgi:hypothetical protein